MENKNDAYQWWKEYMTPKICIDDVICNWEEPICGVYGIFVYKNSQEFCAYVGKSTNIYSRFFRGDGHLVEIKNGTCKNQAINKALQDENSTIKIKLLEEVVFQYDKYPKDMQRLAFAESYYINKYQNLNQCLEQLPEGSNMKQSIWEQQKAIQDALPT